MIDPTYISDFEDDGVGKISSQFRGKVRIEETVKAILAPIQANEDSLSALFIYRWVDTAIGAQLDLLGVIVGERRGGREDEAYRLGIRAKIAINTAKGTGNEVNTIFSLLTGATYVKVYELFPGKVGIFANVNFVFTITGLGPDAFSFAGGIQGKGFSSVFAPQPDPDAGAWASIILNDVSALYLIMDSVLSAGVKLIDLGVLPDDPFAFSGGLPQNKGFGTAFDVTVGGKFASVVPP